MKKKRLVRDEWRVLSDKFVRHHRLPFGTKLVLEHRPPTTGARPRMARNDTTFTRRLFHGRISDTETVADLIDNYLLPSLTVKPSDKGLQIKLRGPNGEEVKKPGSKQIGTVRRWSPLPTPDELETEELLNAEIDEIAEIADLNLREAEELRDDSDRVLRGFLRALVQRYDRDKVREAAAQEAYPNEVCRW
jgi:hypothetical protein